LETTWSKRVSSDLTKLFEIIGAPYGYVGANRKRPSSLLGANADVAFGLTVLSRPLPHVPQHPFVERPCEILC
jgi:hypothetical protein